MARRAPAKTAIEKAIPTAQLRRHFLTVPWIRFSVGAALGTAIFMLIPHTNGPVLRALWGWDVGVVAILAMIVIMILNSTTDHMRQRAAVQDPGRSILLGAIIAGSLVSVVGLVAIQKTMKGGGEASVVSLFTIVGTIVLSWLLVHVVFSLHYAHAYYGPAADEADEDGLVGGLEFPGEPKPDYWDFMYFSFVVGMTCQVSDVNVSGRQLRRLALSHGIVSFFFNTIILALTINILASSL
ncbi:MAG TPA: DUF1345 domain-containing protein [Alphaproteobacteria bacterium]|jgi:uncharacterized membrane protein|nr:DUF1345 domain-containing protein [Alphaproteobacteria bacterium]